MNLIDIAATPLHRVVREVERLAAEHGAALAGGELVGLMPASVAAPAAGAALHLPELGPDACSRSRPRASSDGETGSLQRRTWRRSSSPGTT